jgi:microcystin-dependent protein
MTQPFLGQIQPFGFNFPPHGWALCNGQILSISQNTALFSLLGTQYGGNGQTTFALPNLQSRVPMHVGNGFVQGEQSGVEAVTLLINELPPHSHVFAGTSQQADDKRPKTGSAYAQSLGSAYYGPDASPTVINALTVQPAGSSLPHTNLQPYLTINWCIALTGIFPARN